MTGLTLGSDATVLNPEELTSGYESRSTTPINYLSRADSVTPSSVEDVVHDGFRAPANTPCTIAPSSPLPIAASLGGLEPEDDLDMLNNLLGESLLGPRFYHRQSPLVHGVTADQIPVSVSSIQGIDILQETYPRMSFMVAEADLEGPESADRHSRSPSHEGLIVRFEALNMQGASNVMTAESAKNIQPGISGNSQSQTPALTTETLAIHQASVVTKNRPHREQIDETYLNSCNRPTCHLRTAWLS